MRLASAGNIPRSARHPLSTHSRRLRSTPRLGNLMNVSNTYTNQTDSDGDMHDLESDSGTSNDPDEDEHERSTHTEHAEGDIDRDIPSLAPDSTDDSSDPDYDDDSLRGAYLMRRARTALAELRHNEARHHDNGLIDRATPSDAGDDAHRMNTAELAAVQIDGAPTLTLQSNCLHGLHANSESVTLMTSLPHWQRFNT